MFTNKLKNFEFEQIILILLITLFQFDAFPLLGASSATIEEEGLTYTKLLTLTLFVAVVAKRVLQRDGELITILFGNATSILLLVFIFTAILSLVNSKFIQAPLPWLFRYISITIYLYLLLLIIKDRSFLHICMITFGLASVFSSLAGLYELSTGNAVIEATRWTESFTRQGLTTTRGGGLRVHGLSHDPDGHAYILLIKTGMLFYAFWTFKYWIWKSITIVLLMLVSINVMGSGSRGAWLILLSIFFLFLLLFPFRRKSTLLVSFAGGIVLLFLSTAVLFPKSSLVERITEKFTQSYAVLFRLNMIQLSLEIAKDHPVTGVGAGNIYEYYPKYVRSKPFLLRDIIPYSHNRFATLLAETGIVGFSAYMLMILSVLYLLYSTIKENEDPNIKIMAYGLTISYIVFIEGLSLFQLAGSKYGWTIIGFSVALSNISKNTRNASTNEPIAGFKE